MNTAHILTLYFFHVCLAVLSIRVWRPNYCQYVIPMTSTCPAHSILFGNIWQKLKQSSKVTNLYQTKAKSYGSNLMHSESKGGAPSIVKEGHSGDPQLRATNVLRSPHTKTTPATNSMNCIHQHVTNVTFLTVVKRTVNCKLLRVGYKDSRSKCHRTAVFGPSEPRNTSQHTSTHMQYTPHSKHTASPL